jgi:hypothetical protein
MVRRYRVVTNEMVQHQLFQSHQSNAVTKVTNRLVEAGWLQRHRYLAGRLYFTAGKRLCQWHGMPTSRVRALGVQSLSITMAIAECCLLSDSRLVLQTKEDIASHWTWIPQNLRSMNYAVLKREQATDQLMMLRVDLGGSARHVTNKCLQDWRSRQNVNGFRSLMEERRLAELIFTTSEPKRSLIASEIKKKEWPAGTRFEFFISSELAKILCFTQ